MVVIGLGGTGSDTVIRIKEEVYKQLRSADDNIKYLIIDSYMDKVTKSKVRLFDIDKDVEFFSLFNPGMAATFAEKETIKNRAELAWLDYENIRVSTVGYGAGGIRQIGRFMLVDRVMELVEKLKSTIRSVALYNLEPLTIHICAGICGGTGSGTFLDVCYLVREALKELGIPETRVCGYFFLPDVNLSVPAISSNPRIVDWMSANGFAALKELDYCMNFDKNKDSFKMNYGFKTINNNQKPVDFCCLISSRDLKGRVIGDGYNYAMGVVAEFIINFSNLNIIHDRNTAYNVLGASVAEMPLSDIMVYLGSKLFESYADSYAKMPTEIERDQFLSTMRLKYLDIRNELTRGCPARIDFPERYSSLIGRTYIELLDRYVTQLEYGAFFAQKMLYGMQNQNLVHAVDSFIVENQVALEAEVRQKQLHMGAYEEALASMESSNFLNVNRRMEAYLHAINNLYIHYYRVEMFQIMDMVLRIYRDQLVKLHDNFFKVLTTILDTVRNTFSENRKVFNQDKRRTNGCNFKILSVMDIQEDMDEELRKIDLRATFSNLMRTMINNSAKWLVQDEKYIVEIISDFVLTTFDEVTQKTISDYLKIKFKDAVESDGLLDREKMVRQIETEIIENELAERSMPLFWKNPIYQNSIINNIVIVPYNSTEIKLAAHNFAGRLTPCAIKESGITDKIAMIRFCSGLPLCAYEGIFECQYRYEKNKEPGRHLNLEWEEKLPSPIPTSTGM